MAVLGEFSFASEQSELGELFHRYAGLSAKLERLVPTVGICPKAAKKR